MNLAKKAYETYRDRQDPGNFPKWENLHTKDQADWFHVVGQILLQAEQEGDLRKPASVYLGYDGPFKIGDL
jgi:hypothetical protein